MLGIIRGDSLDLAGAAEAFRRVLDRDPKVAESNARAGQTPQAVRPDLPQGGPPRRGAAALAIDPGPRARPGGLMALEPRLPPTGGDRRGPRGAGPRRVVPRRQPPGRRAQPVRGRGPLPEVPPGDLPGLARQPAHPDLLPRGAASGAPPPGPAPGRSHRPQGHARDQGGRRCALGGDTRRRHRAPLADRVCVRDERPLPDDGQP